MVFLRAGRHVVQIPYEEFEEWVRTGRVHERVEILFEPVTGKRWVKVRELELYRSLVDDEQARFRRQFSLQRFPWVTFVFVCACMTYFSITAMEMVQRGASLTQLLVLPRFDLLVDLGAKEGAHMVELGQWWRLLTFSFLHAGLIHLVPNVFYTAYVGWTVEAVYGRSGTFIIVLFSALGCGLASSMASVVPSVGASGITFGLFTAAVVFGWRYEPLIPPGTGKRFGWAFFPALALFLILGFRSPLVDNWGHLGGILGGGVVAFALTPQIVQGRSDRKISVRWRLYISVLSLFAVVFGLPLLAGPGGLLKLPRLDMQVVHDTTGMSFRLPRYWNRPKSYDPFASDAYTSPSKAMAVSYDVAVQEYPVRPEEFAARLLDEIGGMPGYEVVYDSLEQKDRAVGPEVWRVVTVHVREGDEERIYQRAVTARGCVEYRLTFQNLPESFDRSERLRGRILDTVAMSYPAAIREGEEALRRQGSSWRLHSDLGRSLAIYGETSQAEEELRTARAIAPEIEEPLFWLLFLYDRYDLEPTQRRALVEEVIEVHPHSGDLLALSYEVCSRLGDRDCAGRALALGHRNARWHPDVVRYVEEFGGPEALPPIDEPAAIEWKDREERGGEPTPTP